MGYAERCNPNSEWNKKRASKISNDVTSISNDRVKVSTSVQPNEPRFIELNPIKWLWSILCRAFKTRTSHPQSPEPIS